MAKTHAPTSYTFNGIEVDCVAAIGVMCFSGIRFGGCPFCSERRAATMEKSYITDSLFDLINECDELEAELGDVCMHGDDLLVTMKDGSMFRITVTKEA